MFGTFRLVLAFLVIWYHLVDWRFSGPIAVFGFYCLSGYLMTKVINETYAGGLGGFGRFVLNRALRIYPTYWFALGLSLAVLLLIPDFAGEIGKHYRLPPASPLSDIIVFGHVPFTPSILPQSWSLGIELIFYLAIGALLGRKRLLTVLWFVAGLELVVFAHIHGNFSFRWFYSSIAASSLPFAAGAMLYHFRGYIPRMPSALPAVGIVALVLTALLMPRGFGRAGGIYVGLVLSVAIIATLAMRPANRVDAMLGDLAYPLFLLHYPAGAIALAITGTAGVGTGLLATLISLPLCWFVVKLIEHPLANLRGAVRRGPPSQTPQLSTANTGGSLPPATGGTQRIAM